MMPKLFISIFLIVSYAFNSSAQLQEELLLLVDSNKNSPFVLKDMQLLSDKMQAENIACQIINIAQTAVPTSIAYTPSIVYRNHLGFKLYKGRHTTHQRILNFIRTTRRLAVSPIDYEEKNVFVWNKGRGKLILKLKTTELKGPKADNFNAKKWHNQVLKGLKKGFSQASYQKIQAISDQDELIYCNFYPYRDDQGRIYVSTEIYSHYDCKKPIYTQFKQPANADNVCCAFDSAAAQLFEKIKYSLRYSKKGDALSFVSNTNPEASWEVLPLQQLSVPTKEEAVVYPSTELSKNWTLEGPSMAGVPLLSFNFPAPLRQYGGELKECEGNIQLGEIQQLKGMKGQFKVQVGSVDMGEASLTSAVKSSMLYADKYPTATLVFESVEKLDAALQLGKISNCAIQAKLTIMDKSHSVKAMSSFEPLLDDEGRPFLQVSTAFEIDDLTGMYDIIGPDGPETSNNRLLFQANFKMRASKD